MQKEKKSFDKFVNLYHHILVREFQAHNDSIINLSKIAEPFSFITCSKDKKFKIWNFECECLGEVNTQPSLHQIREKPSDWKFKIDWEKLKEEEIEEVINIFEEVGGEPTRYENNLYNDNKNGQSEDNNTKYNDINSKKNIVKNNNGVKKKRYKPLEEQKKEHRIATYNDDGDFKYDDQYVQEIKRKIDLLITPNIQEIGLVEMSKNIFDSNKDHNLFGTNERKVNFNVASNQKMKKISNFKTQYKSKSDLLVDSRENLFSKKLFKHVVGNKSSKDTLLLPVINNDAYVYNIIFLGKS